MNTIRQNIGKHGTVLMESVLVLPLLTLLIFAIVQFALIWYAKIMTHYAAYNAARAALVYHPAEYSTDGNFFTRGGVCWRAAVQSLSWVAASSAKGADYFIPGLTDQPENSSTIHQQVRIAPISREEANNAVVKVCVEFDYPLHVPVIGRMLAYFAHIVDGQDNWEVWGWNPGAASLSNLDGIVAAHPLGVDYITLRAMCALPKPWSTSRFARIPESER